MINTSLNKQLGIILPNTNRALAAVLKDATPKEIEAVLKDKDLKSVMNSLFKESTLNADSNKTLLNLAKNNPTLKDLGNITTTVKELLGALKSQKNPLPIEAALKSFLATAPRLLFSERLHFLRYQPLSLSSAAFSLKMAVVRLPRLSKNTA